MRSSRIEQNGCRSRVDRERTHNHVGSSLDGLCTRVIELAPGGVLWTSACLSLLLTGLLVLSGGVLSLLGADIGEVTLLTIVVAHP